MFQFFEGILAFIETIVAFVVNGIQLLVSTELNIARALSWLILCIGYLPVRKTRNVPMRSIWRSGRLFGMGSI